MRQPEKVSAKLGYPALTAIFTAPGGVFGEVPLAKYCAASACAVASRVASATNEPAPTVPRYELTIASASARLRLAPGWSMRAERPGDSGVPPPPVEQAESTANPRRATKERSVIIWGVLAC